MLRSPEPGQLRTEPARGVLPGAGRIGSPLAATADEAEVASAAAQAAELGSLGEMVAPTATPEEPKDLVEQHAGDRSRQDDSDERRLDVPGEEVDTDIVGVLERDDDHEDGHNHADHQGHADTGSPEHRGRLVTSLRRGNKRARLVNRIRAGRHVADPLAGRVSSHEPSLLATAPALPAAAGPARRIADSVLCPPATGGAHADWLRSHQPWTPASGAPIERAPAVATVVELLACIPGAKPMCS